MVKNDRKELISKFGTSGFNHYLHIEHVLDFLKAKKVPQKNFIIETIYFYSPEELIGKFNDITNCDYCHQEFNQQDKGYLMIRQTSLEEISVLIDIA